jgi:hypothetical protein
MANNNNNNSPPTTWRDWLSVAQDEMSNEENPLGVLTGKPFSYFDALTRNFTGDINRFQVNLGQFHQNVVVTTGTGSKVKVLHGLFSVNVDPDAVGAALVIGIYGANRLAPFKSLSAPSAVLALNPPKRGNKSKEPEMLIPSIAEFERVEDAEEFAGLVGKVKDLGIENLAKLPNTHFIHPQVFIDIGGKRDWEASHLGYKLISLYKGPEGESDKIPNELQEIHQLLSFLWAVAKQYGTSVTLREIPETGEVASLLCNRRAEAITSRSTSSTSGQGPSPEEAMNDSKRLTEAMVLNLNKSSEAYVRQITKDETTIKSALSRLAPDQAALFNLLTAENFEVDGTPELNSFTKKLTES